MAKAYASEAFARIGIDAVQLHGAVGYTWEFDAHLYLKRSKWARPMYGDSDFHYERVAALGGL
jgi:alkylation response protein AidB-like acyl-CoA dehydrogenase